MEVLQCILNRRSIRKFKPNKVERSVLEEIVQCARYYPSWHNTRVVNYTLIENEEVKNRIASFTIPFNKSTIVNAPQLFVITAVKGRSGYIGKDKKTILSHSPQEWLMFDSGSAVQTLCLAAYAMGVGTVIIGGFQVDEIEKYLEMPEDKKLVALVAIGYPDEEPVAPRRKEVIDILTFI